MSIFAKDCPRCGETNAAYAVTCRCGFAFNSLDIVEEEEQDISVTIQEEELYLEYLRARADQAADSAKRAQRAAAEQPANKAATSQSQQAQAAAEQAKAELEQQRARMKVAMNALPDDSPARREQPASTPPARPQPPVAPSSPAKAPPKPATTMVASQPAPAAAKPTVTPPPVERKEPAPAPVKSPAPAAKGGDNAPPAIAKKPEDLNKYIPAPNKTGGASGSNNPKEVTAHPAQSQTKIPTGHAGARPEAKVHASTPAIANKAVPPTAKTTVTQPVPAKTENPSANKPAIATSASTQERPAPPANRDAGAAPQARTAAGEAGKPTAQGGAVTAKAAAAAARAKQLAEALKAAQAERAGRMKTGAATPRPAQNEPGKTRQEKPTETGASVAAVITKPANGQQPKLNGHDKPNTDISSIHIPGTESKGNESKLNKTVPTQAASAPAATPKQPSAVDATTTGDGPTQRINGTPRSITDNKESVPAKPTPGVTVTVTPGADPQEELEAALKALSLRAPAPPPSDAPKASTDVGDTPIASPDIGNNPEPVVASTSALDELPSLEPVAPANQKDCPNCTALLPMETKRCRCGFRFPEIEETMPGLSLSDSDVAALDGDAPSTGITHLS